MLGVYLAHLLLLSVPLWCRQVFTSVTGSVSVLSICVRVRFEKAVLYVSSDSRLFRALTDISESSHKPILNTSGFFEHGVSILTFTSVLFCTWQTVTLVVADGV